MILADIGNTHIHIYDGHSIKHLTYVEAIEKYKEKDLCYISVKNQYDFDTSTAWKNISSSVHIMGEYETMGVDRKALCLSHDNGIFVDAGSAITVDVVKNSVYQGGFILPGLSAYLQSYKEISLALDTTLNRTLNLDELPTTTKDGISYGIIASIKELIQKQCKGKPLYFTGGDGKFLSDLFDTALYDETLIFKGMLKVIKESKTC